MRPLSLLQGLASILFLVALAVGGGRSPPATLLPEITVVRSPEYSPARRCSDALEET